MTAPLTFTACHAIAPGSKEPPAQWLADNLRKAFDVGCTDLTIKLRIAPGDHWYWEIEGKALPAVGPVRIKL